MILDWQLSHALAGEDVNSVGHRSRYRWCGWFSQASKCLTRFDDMHFDLRRRGQSYHFIVREVALCYVGLEFGSETFLAEIVRVDVDGRMVALVGAGDKVMVRYEEGAHEFSVARQKASKKERRKNSFAVELRPFTYTKILIQDASDRKQKRLIVRVLQDGDEVGVHSVEY